MKDYLRNNSKWILAIFSIFLMMAWLVNPSNKDANAMQSKEPVGTLDGKTITRGDAAQAFNALALAKLLPYGPYTFDVVAKNLILHLDSHNSDIHLYLILTEAKRYGVSVSQEEVNNFFTYLMGLDQRKLEIIASNNNTTSDALRQAVATLLTASKFQNLILPTIDPYLPEFQRIIAPSTTNVDPSLPELQRFLAQCMTKIDAEFIMFDAAKPPAGTPDPTPAQIAAQFAAYKSLLADASGTRPKVDGHDYPFGYRFPDRVKVEYLVFEHDALRKLPAMQPTLEDFATANRIYAKDPSAYPRDPPLSGATAPATLPAYLTFDEVKSKIVDQLVDTRIDQTVKQMADLVQTIAGKSFKPAVDADGYRVRIDDVPLMDYDQIAGEIQTRFGYRPRVVAATASTQPASAPATSAATAAQWLSGEELRQLKGIGAAKYVNQGQSFGDFDNLALNVRALHMDKDVSKIMGVYRQLQVGIEGPLLRDADHNFYIYRVIDAHAAHDPNSVDEVRPQVVEDVRRRIAYERYLAALPQFVDAAKKSGLASAGLARGLVFSQTGSFTASSVANVGPETSPVLQPADTYIPEIGTFPEFAEAAFREGSLNFMAGQAAAKAAPPKSAPSTIPATTPATQLTPTPAKPPATAAAPATSPATAASAPAPTMYLANGHPVASVESEVRLRIYLFEVTMFNPPDTGEFENQRRIWAGEPRTSPDPSYKLPVIVRTSPKTFNPRATDIQVIADRLKFVPAPKPGVAPGKFEYDEP